MKMKAYNKSSTESPLRRQYVACTWTCMPKRLKECFVSMRDHHWNCGKYRCAVPKSTKLKITVCYFEQLTKERFTWIQKQVFDTISWMFLIWWNDFFSSIIFCSFPVLFSRNGVFSSFGWSSNECQRKKNPKFDQ